MVGKPENPHVGEQVIFLALPPGLLDGLPEEDQRAIIAMVGKPVMLLDYDDDGRAELFFDDPFEPPNQPFHLGCTRVHRACSGIADAITLLVHKRLRSRLQPLLTNKLTG